MTCPKCKAQLPPGAVACPKCGTRFKTKICPYCNSAILASATTCPRCGKRFAQGVPQTQAARTSASSQKKAGFRWWYILIGLGIFILGTGVGYAARGLQPGGSTGKNGPQSSAASSDASSSEISSQDKAANAPDSGKLGDYEVSILSARKSSDYEGKPAVIVKFSYTR